MIETRHLALCARSKPFGDVGAQYECPRESHATLLSSEIFKRERVPMLHAISIRQPFASLILTGVKRFEARSWLLKKPGWLLVHASTNFGLSKHDIDEDPVLTAAIKKSGLGDRAQWVRGAIIGAMEVVSFYEWPKRPKLSRTDIALCGDDADVYWRLGDTFTFPRAIPCLGSLNLWTPNAAAMKEVFKHMEIVD